MNSFVLPMYIIQYVPIYTYFIYIYYFFLEGQVKNYFYLINPKSNADIIIPR